MINESSLFRVGECLEKYITLMMLVYHFSDYVSYVLASAALHSRRATKSTCSRTEIEEVGVDVPEETFDCGVPYRVRINK